MRAGTQIGDYTIVSIVGPGRYLAVHATFPRRVVIEVARSFDPPRIVHGGIARIVDRGEVGEQVWRAVELVDGLPLGEIRKRMLPVDAAVMIRDVAEVLSHAHERGTHHGNLAIGSIILTDNGVSIAGWGTRAELPNAFVAPEGAGDPRADVYALGVIAYRMLAGVFPGTSGLLDTTPELAKLVARMLARDPALRPGSAEVRTTAAAIIAQVAAADDRVGGGPRFKRPKWTPPPPELGARDERPGTEILGSLDHADKSPN